MKLHGIHHEGKEVYAKDKGEERKKFYIEEAKSGAYKESVVG